MTAEMIVRDFVPADAEAVRLLNMRASQPEHPAGLEFTRRHYPELLDIPAALQREGVFLVGTVDGAVVAMGALLPVKPGVVELDYMRIAHHLHRRGLGRQMVVALEARARQLGAEAIVLTASLDNDHAHALYLATGFHETGRDALHLDDGRSFPRIHYRKAVTAMH